MKKKLKNIIKKAIHSLGFDLYKLSTNSNSSLQLLKGLENFGVNLVLDVGANTGQFAQELRSIGYGGRILSFEPLPDAYKKLLVNSSKDSLWDIHTRAAVGDFNGEIEINVAGNSVSSSVLPMLDTHSNIAKNSAYVGKFLVPIIRLDSLDKNLYQKKKYFIKIDTQGFEWKVLDGAQEILSNAHGVLCELSLTPLYEGQHLWLDIIDRLKASGFKLWSIQTGFTDPKNGRTLQMDAIFYRDNLPKDLNSINKKD